MKTLPIAAVVLFTACLSSTAFANTYVKCGETADFNTFEVTGYELELSSEGPDDYSGPVGKKWNLKLGHEDSEWLQPNAGITATNYKKDGVTIVEIEIRKGRSVSGSVGTSYKLIGLYDDTPILEKFTKGGFAGSVKIGTFECITGND